jgi:rhodanese-related sulfurtransferase
MYPIKEVDVKTAKEWLDDGDAVMIDVREKVEHDMLHVPDIPLLPVTYFDLAALEEKLPNFREKKLIIMCHSGKRSAFVCAELAKEEHLDCYNLEGGIMCWANNNLPTIDEDDD